MSPLGKLLLKTCDSNVTVNMTEHWQMFYLAGFNKNHVEMHARAIGINIVHKANVNSKPVGLVTLMGIPAPRFGS